MTGTPARLGKEFELRNGGINPVFCFFRRYFNLAVAFSLPRDTLADPAGPRSSWAGRNNTPETRCSLLCSTSQAAHGTGLDDDALQLDHDDEAAADDRHHPIKDVSPSVSLSPPPEAAISF